MKMRTLVLCLIPVAAGVAGILVAAPSPPGGHCEGCPAICWECACPACPPCPSPPVPECQEADGSNQRFCSIHDYGEGLVLEWADGITNLFVGLAERYPGEPLAIDVWTDRTSYALGEPPVHTFVPTSEIRPWYGGHSLGSNAMVVIRLVGYVEVVEDVVYAP